MSNMAKTQEVIKCCTITKQALYPMKAAIEQLDHPENREQLLKMWQELYDRIDRLQDWVSSR